MERLYIKGSTKSKYRGNIGVITKNAKYPKIQKIWKIIPDSLSFDRIIKTSAMIKPTKLNGQNIVHSLTCSVGPNQVGQLPCNSIGITAPITPFAPVL